eukprot:Hpha_TRINITY_DN15843_c0_g1::TRINITY_DN15843_c0_g1_i1::g.187583::m.187583
MQEVDIHEEPSQSLVFAVAARPSRCSRFGRWWHAKTTRPDDTPLERESKELLAFPCLLIFLMNFTIAGTYAVIGSGDPTKTSPISAWAWGLYLVTSVFGYVLFMIFIVGRVSERAVTILIVGGLVSIVFLDWGTIGTPEANRPWPVAILCADVGLCLNQPEQLMNLIVIVVITWLIITSSEDAYRWGLGSIDNWSTPSESDMDSRSCAEQPCAVGTMSGLLRVCVYVCVYWFDFRFTRSFAHTMRTEQARMQGAVLATGVVTSALVRFDLETAEEGLSELDRGDELRSTLADLIANLRLYKPYLPQSVLGNWGQEEEEEEGAEDQDETDEERGLRFAIPGSFSINRISPVDSRASSMAEELASRMASGNSSQGQGQSQNAGASPVLQVQWPDLAMSGESSGYAGIKAVSSGPPRARHGSLEDHDASSSPGKSSGTPRRESEASALSEHFQKRNKERNQKAAQLDVGMRQRKGTILCAEMNDDSENMYPLFQDAERFVSTVLSVTHREQGTILNFDAVRILATWNAHRPCTRHARHAASAGVALTFIWSKQCRERACHMAAASGMLGIGMIGTDTRSPYVLGKPYSQVTVMAELCKTIDSPLLVTENLYDLVSGTITGIPVDVIPIVPRAPWQGTMLVYELILHEDLLRSSTPLLAILTHLRDGLAAKAISACVAALARAVEEGPDGTTHHIVRLLRLAAAVADDERYLRNWVGWSDVESNAPSLDELCERGVLSWDIRKSLDTTRRSVVDMVVSVTPVTTVASKKEEETPVQPFGEGEGVHALQKGIDAVRQGLSGAEADAASLPKNWTDARGDVWRRADKMLGKGAFGEVWLGMAEDGGLCAVKAVRLPAPAPDPDPKSPLSPASPGTRDRRKAAASRQKAKQQEREINDLLTEISILEKLRHDNIVTYVSSAVVGRWVVLCMEYVPGGSLDSVMRNFGGLGLSSVRRYTKEIVRGMAFLHEAGIVHRDFKPGNVLLQIDGLCKIADFGASAELKKVTGEVVGTPLYMAPEACTGNASKASDVWGIGVTVIEMITGEVPYTFTEEDPFVPQIFMYRLGHQEEMMPAIPEPREETKDALEMASACLTRNAEERPTCETLLHCKFLCQ